MKSLAISLKDLQLLIKDRGTWLDLLLVPLVFIVVWSGGFEGLASGDEQGELILVPVVNLDSGGDMSQALIDGINEAGGLSTGTYEQSEAQALLDDHDIDRVLTIPSNFSDDIHAGRQTTLQLVNHPDALQSETEAVNLVVEGVAQDMVLRTQLIASLEQMGDMQAASPSGSQAFTTERILGQAESQWESSRERPLVSVTQADAGRLSSEEETPPLVPLNITVPGLTILFVFTAAQKTASSIFEEKKVGSFRRLLAAPMRKASLIVGKALPNFIIVLLQIVIIFAIAIFLLPLTGLERMTLGKDPIALILLSLVVALCSTSVGIVIAAIARSENQIGGMTTLIMWGMALIGGAMLPSFMMPEFLQGVGQIVPHYWAINAYHSLLVFGGGLADITTELVALLGFTVVFAIFGLWKFDFD